MVFFGACVSRFKTLGIPVGRAACRPELLCAVTNQQGRALLPKRPNFRRNERSDVAAAMPYQWGGSAVLWCPHF
jgi:hypothetical protein